MAKEIWIIKENSQKLLNEYTFIDNGTELKKRDNYI